MIMNNYAYNLNRILYANEAVEKIKEKHEHQQLNNTNPKKKKKLSKGQVTEK